MAPCVEVQSGWTNRQKWNYVKNLYMPSYAIDASGDYTDNRELLDPARVDDEQKYILMFNIDLTAWLERGNGYFEYFLQWQYERGTTIYGNLPQHKKHEHEGHCWAPCPYSTASSDIRSETMLGFVPTVKNDHGIHYMETGSNGASWGFRCTYSGCPFTTISGNEGKKYFYV